MRCTCTLTKTDFVTSHLKKPQVLHILYILSDNSPFPRVRFCFNKLCILITHHDLQYFAVYLHLYRSKQKRIYPLNVTSCSLVFQPLFLNYHCTKNFNMSYNVCSSAYIYPMIYTLSLVYRAYGCTVLCIKS